MGIAAANPLDPVQPITAPVAALAPLILQFSDQNVGAVSQPRQVSLSNTGTASLILSGISLTGTHASEFELSTGDCLAVLLPGNGCTLLITFQPTSDGVRQAVLTVVDNAIGSPHTVALTGAGRLPFTIQLDSSTGTVTAGQLAQYDLRLVPAAGFVGQVSLACSGAPAQSVCGTVLTILFLMLFRTRPAPAVLGPPFRIHCAVLLLLVGVALGLVSCAATSAGDTSSSKGGTAPTATSPTTPSAATGTPAGLYALTLTVTAGSTAQTFQLSLSVQ